MKIELGCGLGLFYFGPVNLIFLGQIVTSAVSSVHAIGHTSVSSSKFNKNNAVFYLDWILTLVIAHHILFLGPQGLCIRK